MSRFQHDQHSVSLSAAKFVLEIPVLSKTLTADKKFRRITNLPYLKDVARLPTALWAKAQESSQGLRSSFDVNDLGPPHAVLLVVSHHHPHPCTADEPRTSSELSHLSLIVIITNPEKSIHTTNIAAPRSQGTVTQLPSRFPTENTN